MIGTDIAHYRITAKLGEGGMGAVYRATDTRLNREVAIKMLPPAFAQNPDRLARLTREAQVLASLNHPNIAAIYGVEEGALIMELVEGQNLRAPIPFQTALDYALQMADALEHAHEKGIVHRDLKPANIRITPEGKLKLLDFGLAKAVESVPTLANPDDSPTITELATSAAGVILGTAGYMSPEQARGQRVDHRTDIWAYGVVLHEMLTGKALFKGGTVSDTIAAILSKDPDLKDAPARFRPLIGRCLQRDPHQRLGWIGEARHLLEAAPVNARPSNLMWVVATCLFALTAAGAGFALLRVLKPTNLPERRFTISPPGLSLSPESRQADISPDGRKIVYIAANQMWIRELERDEAHVVEGSEDATAPFWSPDSQYVGFVIRNRLWKSAVAGGRPVDLAELSGNVRGVTWEADGRNILVSNGLGLRRVSSEGGKLGEYILAVDSIRSYYTSKVIPGTRLLITSTIRLPHLLLLDLETNKIEDLGISGHSPAYSPTGHILYTVPSEAQGSDIWALPFSLQTRKATGPPFPAIRAAGLASVSNDGLIVCTDSVFQRVVLRDREGKVSGIVGVQQPHMCEFSVSRDGKRLATVAVSDGSQSIWIHDLASGVKKRLTADSANEWAPKWSADGKSVAYTSEVHGEYRALIREVASGAVTVVQPATKERTLLEEWSADGQFIFFTEGAEDSRKAAYFRLRPGGNGYEAVTLQEKSARYPRLSPNGRFYLQSAGQYDLVVRPFPSGPESWQVSLESGVRWPRWSRDGREIYFVWNGGLMAAEVSTQGAFSSSRPKMLFRVSASVEGSASASRFEIMPDGSFAFIDSDAPAAGRVPSIRIIENWHPNSGAKPE